MDGKIFLYTQATPPPISYSPSFTFDLQRFELTATEQGDTHVFSVKKTVGDAEKTYYGTAAEFTTENLTGADITEINLFGDVTLTDNIGSDTNKVAATINVTKNATLDLNGKTLTTSADKGFQVSSGKTFTVNDTGEKDANGDFQGKIIHTAYDDDNKKTAKDNRVGKNAINLVDGYDENTKTSFVLNGGTISSKSVSIYSEDLTKVTINDGTVISEKSIAVYFDTETSPTTGKNELTMNGGLLKSTGVLPTIQVSGAFVEKSTLNTITLNGGTVEYTQDLSDTIYANNNPADKRSQGAIFASGQTELNIKDGATVTSSHVGIEFRGGVLNVKGGTIESTTEATDDTAMGFHGTARGASFTEAVAIAVSKSSSNAKKDIDVNISGGTIKGYVALAVANPNDITATTTVNVTGGTLTSTAPTTTKEGITTSTAGDGNDTNTTQYNLKGRNAILNLDKDVTVALSNTEVIGSVAAVTTGRTGTGYDIGSGNTFSNFTYPKNSELVSFYKVDGSDDNFTVNVLGANQNWNTKTGAAANTWVYIVSSGSGEGAVATLAPATGDDATTVLKLTTATSEGTTIPLDLTAKTFEELTMFTTLDASAATSTFALNITGNETITAITGGDGNDTLTAVAEAGVTLNGGTGDDSLVGGAGKDTFIHQSGSDTIDNYDIASDTVTVTNELPTDLTKVSYNTSSSEFVVSLGGDAGDSLTFNSAEQIKLTYQDDVYYYKADRVIKNDKEATLGSAFKEKTFNVNKLNSDHVKYYSVATIDASAVKTAVNITGIDGTTQNSIIGATGGGNIVGGEGDDILQAGGGSTTLNGGEGNDSLKGSTGADVFVYNGGNDSISGYDTNDLVVVRNLKMADASYSVETKKAAVQGAKDTINIVLDFSGDKLTIEDVEDKNVSVRGGYTYNKNYFAHNKGITLAAGYSSLVGEDNTNTYDGSQSDYVTINAAAVNTALSVIGNSLNNYIVGPTAKDATLNGGSGNDRFDVNERYVDSENTKSTKYVFEHDSGKDEVFGFKDNDTLGIAVESITAAKAGNSKLTFTIGKDNSVVLRGDDDITKVTVNDSSDSETKADYLTKDGYVTTTKNNETPAKITGGKLTLFESAKGRIELGDELYSLGADVAIGEVDATSVEKQSVTLVGGSKGGTFKFNGTNKKRDGFVYGGGEVTIEGYEDGKDRIDLNGAAITSFTVTKDENQKPQDVVLKVGDGTNSSNISLTGAAGQEVLLRDGSSRAFKKMVFVQSGILQNKAKNPTMVTVSAGAGGTAEAKSYTVSDNSVKKVFVTDIDKPISIKAGDKNNTIIDASAAANNVTLSGDKKNDKLIGSAGNVDTFVYTAGKDIIQNFVDTGDAKDQISLSSDQFGKLGEAKITAGSKSIKFKFANKDTLTIKATKGSSLSGSLDIASANNTGDITRTYTKNAIAKDGGLVTLTSAFSGTFKTVGTKGLDGTMTTVNGSAVSKNLTFKGTAADESLTGGKKKNTFKGGGGNDSLYGGDGKDIFFYAKGEKGKTTIANFEFGANKDKLKIASGTIGEIKKDGSNIQFAMNSGKKGDTSNIAWFNVDKGSSAKDIAIKANNTFYWFATGDEGYVSASTGDAITQGQLITSDTRVSAGDVSGFDILELNYSTNLAKSGVAVKVAGVKPTK